MVAIEEPELRSGLPPPPPMPHRVSSATKITLTHAAREPGSAGDDKAKVWAEDDENRLEYREWEPNVVSFHSEVSAKPNCKEFEIQLTVSEYPMGHHSIITNYIAYFSIHLTALIIPPPASLNTQRSTQSLRTHHTHHNTTLSLGRVQLRALAARRRPIHGPAPSLPRACPPPALDAAGRVVGGPGLVRWQRQGAGWAQTWGRWRMG